MFGNLNLVDLAWKAVEAGESLVQEGKVLADKLNLDRLQEAEEKGTAPGAGGPAAGAAATVST